MRRFVSNAIASNLRKVSKHASRASARAAKGAVLAGLVGLAALASSSSANAQEIQLTGPLAGAPAVRKMRLHRDGRFEVTPSVSFTLLDQYERTIMPGLKATYHITDWFGIGVWGAFGIQQTTGLSDELQTQAVANRNCTANPAEKACRLTAVNLTRAGRNADGTTRTGKLSSDQMAHINWAIAPQLTFVPFRGKLALFSTFFVDTDVHLFVGPAFIGLQERKPCGLERTATASTTPAPRRVPRIRGASVLASRLAVAPTFGLGLNFYPSSWFGFGAEFRAMPFSWNTSGFDNHGGGKNNDFPDNSINANDREFHFNSLLTVNIILQFPTAIKSTE